MRHISKVLITQSETENQRLTASKQIFGKKLTRLLETKNHRDFAFVDAEIEFGDEIEKLQHSNIKNNIEKFVEKLKGCKSFLIKNCSWITSSCNRSRQFF